MKHDTPNLLKFKRLKRSLQMPLWQVTGLLESVWKLTEREAKQGDIGKLSNEDIAAEIEYSGDADKLISALVDAGWLDRCEKHRLVIHDWADHMPKYIKGYLASKKLEVCTPANSGGANRGGAIAGGLNGPSGGALGGTPTKPNQTPPNQTPPTKPPQSAACRGVGRSEVDGETADSGRPPLEAAGRPVGSRKPTADRRPADYRKGHQAEPLPANAAIRSGPPDVPLTARLQEMLSEREAAEAEIQAAAEAAHGERLEVDNGAT